MLKDFVALLIKRIKERREKAILENATRPGLKPAHRENLVGRVQAYTEVLTIIKRLMESSSDSDITSEIDEDEERPASRRPRRAAPWGGR